MDILSFILGMSVVAIVAVMAFVRVRKQTKEIETLYRNIYEVENHLYQKISNVEKEYQSQDSSVISIMDSRFDKLQNQLKEKQLIKG